MISFKLESQINNDYTYAACEGDIALGKCIFTIDKYTVHIKDIQCNDISVEEGLIRSSLNFAANRNAYVATVSSGMDQFLFEKLGFSGQDILSAEIPEVLTHGCSCGGHK